MPALKHYVGILYFILLVTTFIQGDELDTALDDLMKNENGLHSNIKQCNKYFEGTLMKVVLILTGAWRGSGQQASQLKCWLTCLLRETNLMNTKTNEVDTTAVSQKMLKAGAAEKQQILEVVKLCEAATASETNACEKGYKYVLCVHQKIKEAKSGKRGSPEKPEVEPVEPEEPTSPGSDADIDE